MQVMLADEAATQAFAQRMAACAPRSGRVSLQGDLGAGKTTLVRAFLRALGVSQTVRSPTYTLVEPYECTDRRILHFDLYRLSSPEELEYLGVREDLDGEALCFIEWPERGQGWLPDADVRLILEVAGSGRLLILQASSDIGEAWLAAISQKPQQNQSVSI
ncbi:tRNA threonylcarbamoyladenosine biosynthesis protein TsaE [Ectothiorhodosinus mongolicus]|uniref:tRNA threonylcarbamoyladenosine biosynthesis protein TsaE n=1 Tax=Ectothiorhodosinus mongolicus TaxID=233100 RepID=A0A1R3W421_9GAMM|nr:tRNA (adenosine(37)-N6)-threonylcarbamoyltransferase complex ATPase subunit type 1 TsaE [Ectothiorhodosinus mongolicus]ULX57456.1 tRNA (adenosine(37)-N6)-threonylcarbamoyltransferase complex ATPase subunit type 1 TsaE [Ectothiorhodosinus mongolicus]SIT72290.1 tRNA threonylcarbamoyladenosine biosynthesis protein TsaE [Ectothiorhodosinus mongolicus]